MKICCGTYCHVMGGAALQVPEEIIPANLLKHIDFRYSPCMGQCRETNGQPPYVEINQELMKEASSEKIVRVLKQTIKEVHNDSK